MSFTVQGGVGAWITRHGKLVIIQLITITLEICKRQKTDREYALSTFKSNLFFPHKSLLPYQIPHSPSPQASITSKMQGAMSSLASLEQRINTRVAATSLPTVD